MKTVILVLAMIILILSIIVAHGVRILNETEKIFDYKFFYDKDKLNQYIIQNNIPQNYVLAGKYLNMDTGQPIWVVLEEK